MKNNVKRSYRMWSLGIVACFALMTGCAGTTPKPMSNRARLYFDTGIEYMQNGNLMEALSAFKEAEKLAPHDPEIQHMIGLAYLGQSMHEEAQKRMELAQKWDPDNPRIANNLASVYLESGRLDDTIRQATRALANPDYRTPAAAYYNRGMAYLKKKEAEKASADFLKAIQIEPLFDKPYVELGQIYTDEGNYNAAIKVLDAAVKVNSQNALAYFRRGVARWYRGYVTDSENDFSTVLRLVPESHLLASSARAWLSKIH
ncbi:tetratricopeptide repeat protein [bacterium]|nr:tetratricopeptide repeat protein [candidate division CSSED10-310 bacterium]